MGFFFTVKYYKEMSTFSPSDSFTRRQLCTKVTDFLLCCTALA